MSYDLGDVISLAVTVRNIDGDLADAGAMTLTITAPDGTTEAPPVSNTSTGTYNATYTPTTAGRHLVLWLASGTNAGAHFDEFTVTAGVPVLTPAQVCAKQKVTIPDPASVEGAALERAVEQAGGLVLSYLRRGSLNGLSPERVDAIRAVAVRVAARLWRNPGEASSESYGDHSTSWSDPRIFTGDDKTELRPHRRRRARRPIMLTPTSGDIT